ncbi:MAG: pentapeptide repeat-containing protein [Oscillospiraceae bacterium]|nr:pentapeptide repeat-containing protein [Oscillospiraceae bacterium]
MKNKYRENETFENIVLEYEVIEDCEFTECTFTGCSLSECTLNGCVFNECTFVNCSFSEIKSSGTEVCFGVFEKCMVNGVNWRTLLPEVPLACPIERLKDCKMRYNTFYKIPLNKFDFTGNDITKSEFTECNLSGSSFKGCDLEGTEFFRCDLTKADMRDAKGYRIDILTSKLKNARFSYPDVMALLDGIGIKIE